MTQIDAARAGIVTPQMEAVARKEGRSAEFVRAGVAAGRIAIPANVHHTALSPEGVGEGLRTKVNVNLGISGDVADEAEEWKKVDVALELGAEARMNHPGIVDGNNWRWRLREGQLTDALADEIAAMTKLYGRA